MSLKYFVILSLCTQFAFAQKKGKAGLVRRSVGRCRHNTMTSALSKSTCRHTVTTITNYLFMKIFLLLLLINCTSIAFGQTQTGNTEATIRLVADRIIQNTSFKFIDPKTGRKYDSVKSTDTTSGIKADSKYNRWDYVNGVITVGMMQTAKVLNDSKYSDYSQRNFDFIFGNIDYFEKQYNAKAAGTEFSNLFRMGSLDDCGAISAGLADVYVLAPKKVYRAYLDKAANYISNVQLRLADHTLSRSAPRNMTLWADDMYMSIPFLARMAKITNNSKYFDDAILQVENFNKYLYDPHSGLYFHNYYSDVSMNGVAHWGRCNGWIAMATVELLNNLARIDQFSVKANCRVFALSGSKRLVAPVT